jgi:hypothetical protein
MRRIGFIAFLALSACATLRLARPAAPQALDCALQFGLSKGYQPTAGGTSAGFVRLERGQFDVLTVTVAADSLHVEAKQVFQDRGFTGPSSAGRRDAADLLRRCGSSA